MIDGLGPEVLAKEAANTACNHWLLLSAIRKAAT
jgi:hypothetical protein